MDEYGDECEEFVSSPTLAEVVKHFEDRGIDLSLVTPDYWKKHHSSTYSHPNFSYVIRESQEEYAARMDKHNKELLEYNKWYKETTGKN